MCSGAAPTLKPSSLAIPVSWPRSLAKIFELRCCLLETNTNIDAVELMLDLGFPVAHPEQSHGYSALHNAAWSGSPDLVDMLIARGAPVDLVDEVSIRASSASRCTTAWWRSATLKASLAVSRVTTDRSGQPMGRIGVSDGRRAR